MRRKGQALAEFVAAFPVLVMFLLAAVYFGHAISIQQQLTVAAGAAARQAALESTQEESQRRQNTFAASLTASTMQRYALAAVPGLASDRVFATPPEFTDATPFGTGYAALFSRELGSVTVGAVLYGVRLRYELRELRPLARVLGLPSFDVVAIGVSAGELPLRMEGSKGLLDLNRELFDTLLQP